eukprot:327148_1
MSSLLLLDELINLFSKTDQVVERFHFNFSTLDMIKHAFDDHEFLEPEEIEFELRLICNGLSEYFDRKSSISGIFDDVLKLIALYSIGQLEKLCDNINCETVAHYLCDRDDLREECYGCFVKKYCMKCYEKMMKECENCGAYFCHDDEKDISCGYTCNDCHGPYPFNRLQEFCRACGYSCRCGFFWTCIKCGYDCEKCGKKVGGCFECSHCCK